MLGAGTFRPAGYAHAAGSIFEMTEREMIAGNASMPNPGGGVNMTGNSANGVIRITRLTSGVSVGGPFVLIMGG